MKKKHNKVIITAEGSVQTRKKGEEAKYRLTKYRLTKYRLTKYRLTKNQQKRSSRKLNVRKIKMRIRTRLRSHRAKKYF